MIRHIILLTTIGLFSSVAMASEYLECNSNHDQPAIKLAASFSDGQGTVTLIEGNEVRFFDRVDFAKGMWLQDRLNFWNRAESLHPYFLVGIVDNYYNLPEDGSTSAPGIIYGDGASITLSCTRYTCNHCYNLPFPSPYCREQCGCSSPFCGAW